MMKALRRHKDWLMIVIAILAIPFIFYFVQRPDYGAMRSDQFAHMYDRNVSMLEARKLPGSSAWRRPSACPNLCRHSRAGPG